jgi:hypothetical protein
VLCVLDIAWQMSFGCRHSFHGPASWNVAHDERGALGQIK